MFCQPEPEMFVGKKRPKDLGVQQYYLEFEVLGPGTKDGRDT